MIPAKRRNQNIGEWMLAALKANEWSTMDVVKAMEVDRRHLTRLMGEKKFRTELRRLATMMGTITRLDMARASHHAAMRLLEIATKTTGKRMAPTSYQRTWLELVKRLEKGGKGERKELKSPIHPSVSEEEAEQVMQRAEERILRARKAKKSAR